MTFYPPSAYDQNQPYRGASHTANGVQLVPGAPGYDANAAAPWHREIAQSNAYFGVPGAVGGIQDTWSTGAGGGPTGGLAGLGGFDADVARLQAEAAAKAAAEAQNKSTQGMFNDWASGFGANRNGAYDPTGVGGSFSQVQSPVYRPEGWGDAPRNGGGSWGGPFGGKF